LKISIKIMFTNYLPWIFQKIKVILPKYYYYAFWTTA